MTFILDQLTIPSLSSTHGLDVLNNPPRSFHEPPPSPPPSFHPIQHVLRHHPRHKSFISYFPLVVFCHHASFTLQRPSRPPHPPSRPSPRLSSRFIPALYTLHRPNSMEFTPPNTQPGDPHLVAPSPSLPSDLHHLTAPPHFSFANYGAPPTLPAGPRIGTSTAATTSSLAALVSPTPPNSPVLTPNPFSFGNYWQRAMSAPPSSFNFLQGPVGPSQAWPGWHRHHPGSKCPASPSASSPAHLITKTIEEVQEPRVPLCFYVPLNCLASFTVKVMSTKPAGTRATRNSQRGVVPDTEEAEEAESKLLPSSLPCNPFIQV